MSENTTHNLPGTRSFEERVFARFDAMDARFNAFDARFDAVDAGLRDLNARVQSLEARVQTLEDESQRRAVETKPLWERALAEIAALRQDLVALGQKVDELVERVEAVERKLDVFWNDMLTLRSEQRRLDQRVYKLESKTVS